MLYAYGILYLIKLIITVIRNDEIKYFIIQVDSNLLAKFRLLCIISKDKSSTFK